MFNSLLVPLFNDECFCLLFRFNSYLLLQFDIPATYPTTAPEIELPELEGKTAKMYRGGKICLTIHFKPLWAKNR